jgi:hypothetical protein
MALLYTQESGGSAMTAATTVPLTEPQVQGPLSLFQQRYFLRIAVNAQTAQLSLGAQTTLQIVFQPAAVSIGMAASAWHRSPPQRQGDEVEFDLVRPVRVAALGSSAFQQVQLFRMDGARKVDDPSVDTATGVALSDDFSASRFTAALSVPKPSASSANVLSVLVNGYPTSPRLKLSMHVPAKVTDEVLWQWLEFPGEQSQPCTATITADTWQPALDRALALRTPGQTELVLFLDVISDAPCRAVITPSHDEVRSQAQATDPAASVGSGALRFSGQQPQCQIVILDKPAGNASSVQVRLRIAATESSHAADLPPPETLGQQGFRLAGGDWLARFWPQAGTSFNVGLCLPWWPLEGDSALILSLHADHVGHPADMALAQAGVDTSTTHPHWLIFRWPEVPLQPGSYWVRLRVTKGGGLWLGEWAETPLPVARQSAQQPHQHLSTPMAPLLRPLSAGASAGPGVTCTLQGEPMVLEAEPGTAVGRWRASLAVVPPPLQSGSQWQLAICSDNGALVRIDEVLVGCGA